ncbi:MAG TPA: long-chain fatty acid--CoA ligase [Streptosporangiaceae bacterium]
MREFSVPPAATVPDSDNVPATIFRRGAEEPETVALRRKAGDGWQDVTCAQFRDDVAELSKGLIAAGVQPGDRVALMSRTRYEWTLCDYAILATGAVVVPIYETSSAEQVAWIAGDSGAVIALVEDAGHAEAFAAGRAELPDLRAVHVIDDGGLDDLTARAGDVDDETLADRRGSRVSADIATIVYTSGTTGRPKGCEITHGNLLSDVRNAVEGALTQVFTIRGGSTLLFLPLAHVFARIIQIGCLEAGTVLGHTSNVADLLPDLDSFKPSFILAVPRVFEKVYNGAEQKAASEGKGKIFHIAADTAIAYSKALDTGRPALGLSLKHTLFDKLVYGKLRAAVGGRVEYAVSGGAALGDRLGHFFRGVGITIIEGYGLTETTAAVAVNLPKQNKIGTVGPPLPGCSVRVADDGELLFRGPNIFSGYWKNEKATKEMLDDGWLRSGDLGSVDADGFISVTGRKKELIVTAGGKNVAPAVLEDRLRGHPLISQCMVVGDGKPFIGCLITLDTEALDFWKTQHNKPADLGPAELRDDPVIIAEVEAAVADANKAVSHAESIKKFRILPVDFTEEGGQMTPSLKVKRAVVAKDFAADIEQIYNG